MPEEQNYYEEMGIPLDAADSQIKEAYKKLAKKYHPDLNPDMPQWAANQMKKLNRMYDTLSSPHRRQDYDRVIGAHPLPHLRHGESASGTTSPAKEEEKVEVRHKRFGGLSAKTIRTTGIGMLVSGIIAFLILSFLPVQRQTGLPIKPSRNKPTQVSPSGRGTLQHAPASHEKADISQAEVHYKKGIDYVENDKLPEAAAELEKALEINPEHFHAHAYLGFVYDAEGRLDKAIHEYEKAISIKPDFADAYYGLSAIYKKKGMYDRAERELEIYKWLTEGDTE